MRILHIITRLIVGGAQRNTILTCAAQVAAGHQVTLVHGPIYGPEGSLLDEAKQSGAEPVELPTLRRAVLPLHDPRCYRALRKLIRERKPEVVHTHSSKAGILGRAAAWAEHVPAVIHTVHGLPFHDRQSFIARRLYIALEKWAANRCHHLIAITPAMAEAFEQAGIADRSRFTIIPSGVDLARFEVDRSERAAVRRELTIPDDALVVALVGRLDPLKGHDDLLDIFAALERRLAGHMLPGLPGERAPLRSAAKQWGRAPLRGRSAAKQWGRAPLRGRFAAKQSNGLWLLFIGDGWHRAHLEQRVAEAQLQDRAIFTGLVEHRRVGRLLTAADVNVLPSYQEGQSRTLIEALLAGCGIVAYDVGGIPSICIDGETGRLVPKGDKAALAEGIAWMFEHPDQREAMVMRGQALVRERFDAQQMVTMIDMVYRKSLATEGISHG